MGETSRHISEGEALGGFLDELERQREIKEIAGMDSGFVGLNRALDGILPGLYFLIWPPGCGKTSLAKQLLDQIALTGNATGLFFSFRESKKELRIKTLARLSAIEAREIRRGSAYLLHWYGSPRLTGQAPEQLSPSWEKVRRSAENARGWLDSIFLLECAQDASAGKIEAQAGEILGTTNKQCFLIVIDDAQRLAYEEPLSQTRLAVLAARLSAFSKNTNAAVLAVWPDLRENGLTFPQTWAEKIPDADVVMVVEELPQRADQIAAFTRPVDLHIVKNRTGERGKISFNFNPAFAKFAEIS